MKMLVENGKICNQTTMGERPVEVRIVNETDALRLNSYNRSQKSLEQPVNIEVYSTIQ